MSECFICGIPDSKAVLFDAIGDDGIMKVCKNCLKDNDLPFLSKSFSQEDEKVPTVYERLSRTRGLNPQEHRERISSFGKNAAHDSSLRELVERNYEERVKNVEKKKREDLVDNFHWVIMRARRAMKLTSEQLAKKLGEPVNAIRLAEKGILPQDYTLARKLETFLRINIIKREVSEEIEMKKPRFSLEPDRLRELTIEDLRKMKREKEIMTENPEIEKDVEIVEEIVGKTKKKKWYNFFSSDDERDEEELTKELVKQELEKKNSVDLSDSDIKDLIWKR